MKYYYLNILFILIGLYSFSQPYYHPTTGIQNEYVGACMETVGTTAVLYYDDGGPGSNYSNNIDLIYRVFCPSVAGHCMRVTFTSFDVEPPGWFFGTIIYDYLTVGNGPTQNSPLFTTPPADASGYIYGNPSTPFSYTSTDASGCLTFRFYSDGSVTYPGWTATLQAIPCSGGPNGTDNNDCINRTALCGAGISLNGNSTGPGIVAEGCTGSTCPAGGENHSNWYYIQAQTSGTIDITLIPNNPSGDYDIAVYGPNVTCSSLGPALRCTDSGNTGNTGLGNGAADFTEDVTGDGWVASINATAGDTYIIMVDEWTPNSAGGYQLNFGGTASLDCIILPIELSSFDVEYDVNTATSLVRWTTSSERDNDFFEVERSKDGVHYEVIGKVDAVGNSTLETQYILADPKPFAGVNYYRLKQTDINGKSRYSAIKTINILDEKYDVMSVFPNPAKDYTEVIFNGYKKGKGWMTVKSVDGKTIVNEEIDVVPGTNRIYLDLSRQPKGFYQVLVNTNEKSHVSRLIIK